MRQPQRKRVRSNRSIGSLQATSGDFFMAADKCWEPWSQRCIANVPIKTGLGMNGCERAKARRLELLPCPISLRGAFAVPSGDLAVDTQGCQASSRTRA